MVATEVVTMGISMFVRNKEMMRLERNLCQCPCAKGLVLVPSKGMDD